MAVHDPVSARRHHAINVLKKARIYDDLDLMLDGEALDFVDIASPPVFHAAAVRKALEAGANVLVEKPLSLTTKEFDLLWILLRDAGKVVTREQIMREVWDAKWWTSTKTLDMHISWLRRKLGDDAHHPMYITTVRGVGFRFERGD